IRSLRRLPSLAPTGGEDLPGVSVVIAARDEEARIETTVRGLLGQQGVRLEVIVVNDRSRDGTGKILERLAAEDPRLKAVRLEEVPPGWLGKCYACHRGSQEAGGEWLLFTDGDIWMTPDLLARAIRTARQEGAAHLALLPGVREGSILGKACQLIFFIGQARMASQVNQDRPGAHLGSGAFNLVRADTYRAVGGYETLRLTVLDDLKLSLLLRRAGRRSRLFVGRGELEADWAPTLPGMIKALEKNHFAVVHFRLLPVLLTVLLVGSLWSAAVVGPWGGSVAGMAAGVGLCSLILPAALAARRFGWPRTAAVLAPFILPVLLVSLVNSTVVTLLRRGIWWRDTFYPLAILRTGGIR
ncbi:MAG: glycosyltransferase family 2 protein, partial [Planctomycetes bacterium]|nr:glycosyltransferase family 2 protein [Planctomycetota bacterium]